MSDVGTGSLVAAGQHPVGTLAPATGSAVASLRPVVIVVGMGRSGMAICSHALAALGVSIGEEGTHDPWERPLLSSVDAQILQLFDCDVRPPFFDMQLPPAWLADPRLRGCRRELATYLRQQLADEAPFGFTDPLAASVMPLWHQLFREFHLAPRIIFCVRNPVNLGRAVAEYRKGLEPSYIEYRWFTYALEVFRHLRKQPICLLHFEDWFIDPRVNLDKLVGFLNSNGMLSDLADTEGVPDLIEARRYEIAPAVEPRQPLIRSLYRMIRSYAEDARAGEQIAQMAEQFTILQQVQRPLHTDYVNSSRALANATREISQLRNEVDENAAKAYAAEDQIAAIQAKLQEITAIAETRSDEAAALHVSLGQANAALAEARQELTAALHAADAHGQAHTALRQQIAGHEARIAAATRDALEATTSLASARQELAAAQDAVRATDQQNAELRQQIAGHEARAAAATKDALEATTSLVSVRQELAAAQDAVRASEQQSAGLLGQIASMQAAMNEAAAATTANRQELAAAQDQLLALTQTGGELRQQLSACEAEAGAPAESDARVQHRQAGPERANQAAPLQRLSFMHPPPTLRWVSSWRRRSVGPTS